MKLKLSFLLFLLSCIQIIAQNVRTSAEIMESMHKLNVLGSVLYVAAHPDDENTRLITHLSKGLHLRTAYVSLTRGDGGQNLIGSELDENLGVIRTHELLQARNIDGGSQYFTRANDFGYSKTAEETFNIWDKDTILSDLLRVVREFKPDVIINRFDHRTSGRTHGHHTASAILGKDAFQYCNSPLYMKDDLSDTEAHLVQRLFFNTSWWFYGSREKFDSAAKTDLYQMDVGEFYPALGYSNNEIAAQSRSMHKSQGFGINSSRGKMLEYFERLDKTKDNAHMSPFDGMDFSWNRLNGGGNVKKIIDEAIMNYDHERPWLSIPLLQKAEQYIIDLDDLHWKNIKLKEVRDIIFDCAGLYAEAFSSTPSTSPGSEIEVNTEFIIRNPVVSELIKIEFPLQRTDSIFNLKLEYNQSVLWKAHLDIPENSEFTCPHWLYGGRPNGYYKTNRAADRITAVKDRNLKALFTFRIGNQTYTTSRNIHYKFDDPVLGEIHEDLDILPGISVQQDDQVFLTSEGRVKIKFKVKANNVQQKSKVSLQLPASYSSKPNSHQIDLQKVGDQQLIEFEIQVPHGDGQAKQIPILINGQQSYVLTVINYPHIGRKNVLIPAKLNIIPEKIKISPKRIAYVEGAGDVIDETVEKMGFSVTRVKAADIDKVRIKDYEVLIFGIRALNNQAELATCKNELMRFMESGGKVIFQYNTTADLVTNDFAPAALKIGRGRVTNESSKVDILKPQHPVFNQPNKITQSDFDGWVQERGLYFPSEYDSSYEELLMMSDPGEAGLKSSLLVRPTGKGYFIYTSLAWFRQLKAGVPGAYKLFSNIISF